MASAGLVGASKLHGLADFHDSPKALLDWSIGSLKQLVAGVGFPATQSFPLLLIDSFAHNSAGLSEDWPNLQEVPMRLAHDSCTEAKAFGRDESGIHMQGRERKAASYLEII